MALLAKNALDIRILSPEDRQLLLCHLNLLFSILQTIPLTKLCGEELQFTFRTPGEFSGGTIAFPPTAINVGVTNTDIKWVESHLDLGSFDGWVTHGFAPVVQVIHAHTHPWLNFRRPFAGGGK